MPYTCPDCGGPRKPCSTRCDLCYRKNRRANATHKPPNYTKPCIDCGTLGDSHRQRCRDCYYTNLNTPPDIDEMAVERLKTGSPVQSNKAERQQAAAELLARGLTNQAVAQRLHVSTKTIERYKAAA